MKTCIYILLIAGLFLGCKKNPLPLTPARQLAGNWTTPNAVTFYYSSDGCGTYNRYSSFQMKVNWQIAALGDSSVDITWTLVSSGSQTNLGSNCGLPAPPLAFPLHFMGIITGSKFALDEKQMVYSNTGAALGLRYVLTGVFSFTTNNITGTVTEKSCPIYCSGFSTDLNTCILTKVN